MNETLYTKAFIEEKSDDEITAIASTAVEDRQGEIVEVSGWDLKDFKANPIILWGHDHSQLPIGKATKIWVEGAGKTAKLMVKIAFQEVTELGRAVKQLVKDDVLKTLSVGFIPMDGEDNRFTAQKLLEISVVNVPANPQALMLSYKSLKDAGFDDDTINKAGIPSALVEEVSQMRQDMAIMKGQIDSAVKGIQHLNPHLGRKANITEQRLSMSKVIDRATSNILTGRKAENTDLTDMARTIKRANEIIITSLKGELKNGKN